MAFGKFKIFETDDDVVTTNDQEYYSVSSEEVKKGATGKMILVEPRAYSESQEIADHLKSRNSVVVNFKRVTNDQAKRIIDFLSGCIYAIGGSMQKIGVGIYLCTPKNVNVEGTITDDSEKKEKEDYEEIDL